MPATDAKSDNNPTSHTGSKGDFIRWESQFRNWITPDGSAGPSGNKGFKAEVNRYHLYVSYACPWAHRTQIFRSLKNLEKIISISVVHPKMGPDSWHFDDSYPGATEDHINGFSMLLETYQKALGSFTGVVTVPVLWDKSSNSIVNNESSEIIRMLNSAFDAFTNNKTDYYPPSLQNAIDSINDQIYNNINNGVYRCGFAKTQKSYEHAFDDLFSCLDNIEKTLSAQRYLLGNTITEADWRLLPTLLRFDPVYVGHFKCNLRRISDYPNISNYMRELYQHPGIAETFHLAHVKYHYYASHTTINPVGLVPLGPELDYDKPHDRGRFSV